MLIAFNSYPPRHYPESLRHPQTPSRHIPDTLQTPQNIAHFDQSKATRGKKEQTNKKCLIGCLSIACTPYPPDNIQIHSDNHQAPLRHIPDNLQTFWGNWERRNQLIKITLIRFLLSINFTSYPHHTTPHNVQSHSVNPRHLPEILQTPYRHPKIGHPMSNPGSLREGTSQLKHISMFLHLSFIN